MTDQSSQNYWKKCSNCKKEIPFKGVYQVCSVSTCNVARRALQFCSVPCWSSHVPLMRHRDAWAIEKTAPSREEFLREQKSTLTNAAPVPAPSPVKHFHRPSTPSHSGSPPSFANSSSSSSSSASPSALSSSSPTQGLSNENIPRDILVVASKLKSYIRARSDMSTSADVLDKLSDELRKLCDRAIQKARTAERKTVMARDF